MDKENEIHTYSGTLLTLKKGEILLHTSMWRNFEGIILNEISQL
jgi:hypothetical protein